MQSANLDLANPEGELLLADEAIRRDRSSSLHRRLAAALLVVASCAVVAFMSTKMTRGASSNLANKDRVLQLSSKSSVDCRELRHLVGLAQDGAKSAVEDLKSMGVDIDDLDEQDDPCSVDLQSAGVFAIEKEGKGPDVQKKDKEEKKDTKDAKESKTSSLRLATTDAKSSLHLATDVTSNTSKNASRMATNATTVKTSLRSGTAAAKTTSKTSSKAATTTTVKIVTNMTKTHTMTQTKTNKSSLPADVTKNASKNVSKTTTNATAAKTSLRSGKVAAKTTSKTLSKVATNTTATTTTNTMTKTFTVTQTTSNTDTTTTTTDECSKMGEDCRSTKCCSDPGMQCYAKNKHWAQCKEWCVQGKDPTDVDSTPWNCTELGGRTPGEPLKCKDSDENCMESKCCNAMGYGCFAKNDTWAACKSTCVPGPDYTDQDGWEPWTCNQLSGPRPSKASWVKEECAADGEDCHEVGCCQTSGSQCYEMGEGWAQCKAECSTVVDPERSWEDPWTCKEIGQRTPASDWDVPLGPPGGKVASWVKDYCSKGNDDCTKTQCCAEANMQCFTKDNNYAKCMEECDEDGWDCNYLGSQSYGWARKSWPSLFCFSVIHICPTEKCYEFQLMNRVYELGPESAGIFGCDDWAVASNEPAVVGEKDTLVIPGNISVGISKHGTAANTELFMAVWDMVIEDGRYRMHDWVVKVDPDAVLCPWKLTDRLAPHTNTGDHEGRLYVVNCNAWPDSEDFPMMYGSVEIFTRGAITQYATHIAKCKDRSILPWDDWGEDYFITRCLDQIDVGRLEMFDVVGDNVCVGPGQTFTGDCGEESRAAFHPFKNIEEWTDCYNKAVGYHPEGEAMEEEEAEGAGNDWDNLNLWQGRKRLQKRV